MKKLKIILFLVPYILLGAPRWIARYNPYNNSDWATAITCDNSYVYVTGCSVSQNNVCGIATIKYNFEGIQEWVARYSEYESKAYDIAVDNNGNVYVTGSSMVGGMGRYQTIKYNPNGYMIWSRTYGGQYPLGPSNARAIAIDANGNVYVTGRSVGSNTDADFATIKYGPNGEELWIKRYNHANLIDEANAIAVDNFGNVYVTGRSNDPQSGFDGVTIKYSPLGQEMWVRRYSGPENKNDSLISIAVDNSGNVYVTGTVSLTSPDYVTIKYNSNGVPLWVNTYDSGINGIDCARSIAVDESGNVYVTGESWYYGSGFDYVTIKYAPNGNLLWCQRYDGGSADYPTAIVVDNFGNVYVTGKSAGSNGYDCVTIKYNPDGIVEWIERYNNENANGDDGANAIAVDNWGNVYITGYSEDSSGFPDYITISYGYGNIISSDEPYALAYNTNRHLVRKEGTNNLYMVFTSGEKIFYTFSPNGGSSWYLPPFEIGGGRFPAIALDRNGLPSVCWTDSIGGLWYRRKTSLGWWSEIYHLYNPWVYWQPRLTSPPSMCITPDDTVHILTNLYLPANGIMNAIVEWAFHLQNPYSFTWRIIEDATYLLPDKAEYPSIAYSIDPAPPINSNIILHATWQHADTIYYATRKVGNNWVVWNWQMWNDSNRTKSSHPFVETYGDVVSLVWSRKTGISNLEDVYKAKRYLHYYFQPSQNISQSPFHLSLYPINSFDSYTLYTEMIWPQPDEQWSDIFLNGSNISNTPNTRSIFSHSQVKRTSSGDYLYVIYLEGNEPPYEIKFLTLSMGTQYITPYITSIAGEETPSPYLIKRDTFFSNWQIPVDIGYDNLKYRFILYPGYKYILKSIVYWEGQIDNEYKEWIKIDDKLKRLIKYVPFKPETTIIHIPPGFYKDSVIDVVFERKTSEYAISGPIYIYAFEEFEEIGKFENEISKFKDAYLNINSFKLPIEEKEILFYDLAGRNIKEINLRKFENKLVKGIYFIKIKDKKTGEERWVKFIKIK